MSDQVGDAVRASRERAGLSRGQLATAAKISLASLRRMEANRVARLGEALKVAAALNEPPDKLFEPAFAILRARGVQSDDRALADLARNDREFRKEMADAGLDPHPLLWTLKVHFRGGEVRDWSLCSVDLDRFWNSLDQARERDPFFFAFDSDLVTVAFNVSQLAHAHALFDAATDPLPEEPEAIRVLLADEREWLEFGAEWDEPHGDDPGAYQGQLAEMLTDLEGAPFGETFVSFDDEDGERAVFRVDAVAAIEVPQHLLWGRDDGIDEELADDMPPKAKRS